MRRDYTSYLAKEPSNEITEHNSLVCLIIAMRCWDASSVPEIGLPFVQPPISRLCVDEQYSRGALNQPSAIYEVDPSGLHVVYGLGQLRYRRCKGFHFDSSLQRDQLASLLRKAQSYRCSIKRADKSIAIAILSGGDGCFGLDYRIDTSH